MTQVRFGVTSTGGWGAPIIRWATKSSVNHAFVVNGDGLILEARPGGLGENNLSSYPDAILSDPVDGDAADEIWAWTVAHKGTKYGWLDILAITLLCLHIPTPRWALRRLDGAHTLICSQAVMLGYDAAGIHLGDKPAALTTPGDLLAVLRKLPEPADR